MLIIRIMCYIFIAFSAIIIFSCKNNIVDPKEEPPGRRDYIWKVDTLDMPKNIVNDIWGASANDVWAIGDMLIDVDQINHFDGNKWSRYTNEIFSSSPNTIFGLSKDEVWIGSGSESSRGAFIWKWDGKFWNQQFYYSSEGCLTSFTDIYGNSNDLYACGLHFTKESSQYHGFIIHYDGTSWKEFFVAKFNSQFWKLRNAQGMILISMIKGSNLDSISIAGIKKNKIENIYSVSKSQIRQADFEIISNEIYIMINKGIYKYSEFKYFKLLEVDNESFGYRFYGRSENDIFLRMKDGLAHFNGKDIKYLYHLPSSINVRANHILFEKDVFFCLWDQTKGYIQNRVLHGSLDK